MNGFLAMPHIPSPKIETRRMSGIDMEFLAQACLRPWRHLVVGGIDQRATASAGIPANHIHVDGEVPFLIAARSLELPTGNELFAVTAIADPIVVSRYLEGPYPPHNRPRTLCLDEVAGADIGEFMLMEKRVHTRKRMVRMSSDVTTLLPVEQCLTFEAGGMALSVCADEAVPMGIVITWSPRKEG